MQFSVYIQKNNFILVPQIVIFKIEYNLNSKYCYRSDILQSSCFDFDRRCQNTSDETENKLPLYSSDYRNIFQN